MYGVLKISLFCQAAIYNDVLDDDEDGEDFNEEGNQEEDDDDDIDEEDGKITLKTATQKYFKPTTSMVITSCLCSRIIEWRFATKSSPLLSESKKCCVLPLQSQKFNKELTPK